MRTNYHPRREKQGCADRGKMVLRGCGAGEPCVDQRDFPCCPGWSTSAAVQGFCYVLDLPSGLLFTESKRGTDRNGFEVTKRIHAPDPPVRTRARSRRI
jgi:hypothetical protein